MNKGKSGNPKLLSLLVGNVYFNNTITISNNFLQFYYDYEKGNESHKSHRRGECRPAQSISIENFLIERNDAVSLAWL